MTPQESIAKEPFPQFSSLFFHVSVLHVEKIISRGESLNNRGLGVLLIGVSLLTSVIVYALGEVVVAIKRSVAFLTHYLSETPGGPSLSYGQNNLLSSIPLLVISISVLLGLFLIVKKD